MLTFEQIKELIDLVARHRLSGVELERSGFRLKVDGQATAPAAAAATTASAASSPAPDAGEARAAVPAASAAAPAAELPPQASPPPDDAHVLTSPIVGTFYRSPNPDSPAFVEVGDKVKKGQVLCIVEAMKLMNEIESDVDGTIAEIFPQNAQAVEYGERLFAIRAA